MIELITEEPQKNKTHKWRLYWFHESDLDASYPADVETLRKAGFIPAPPAAPEQAPAGSGTEGSRWLLTGEQQPELGAYYWLRFDNGVTSKRPAIWLDNKYSGLGFFYEGKDREHGNVVGFCRAEAPAWNPVEASAQSGAAAKDSLKEQPAMLEPIVDSLALPVDGVSPSRGDSGSLPASGDSESRELRYCNKHDWAAIWTDDGSCGPCCIECGGWSRGATLIEQAQLAREVGELKQQVADCKADARQARAELQDEWDGNASIRDANGALPNETMGEFVARLRAQLAQSEAGRAELERQVAWSNARMGGPSAMHLGDAQGGLLCSHLDCWCYEDAELVTEVQRRGKLPAAPEPAKPAGEATAGTTAPQGAPQSTCEALLSAVRAELEECNCPCCQGNLVLATGEVVKREAP